MLPPITRCNSIGLFLSLMDHTIRSRSAANIYLLFIQRTITNLDESQSERTEVGSLNSCTSWAKVQQSGRDPGYTVKSSVSEVSVQRIRHSTVIRTVHVLFRSFILR